MVSYLASRHLSILSYDKESIMFDTELYECEKCHDVFQRIRFNEEQDEGDVCPTCSNGKQERKRKYIKGD